MTVQVRPATLDEFAGLLERFSTDASQAGRYLMAGTELPAGDAGLLFRQVLQTNENVRSAVAQGFGRLGELARTSSRELSRSADLYRETDARVAARLDRADSRGSMAPHPLEPGEVSLDVTSPATRLVPPRPAEPMPSVVDTVLSLPGLVSPGHWLMVVLHEVCGVNPAEWVAEWVSGEWESVARAGDALERLSHFDGTFADGTEIGTRAMLDNWDGEAASAAGAWFSGLQRAVERHSTALADIAQQYQRVAYGIWSLARSLTSALEAMLDAAIRAAIKWAAAAATSETVVGGVAFGIWGAYDLLVVQRTWTEVVGIIGTMEAAVHGFVGACAGLLGDLHGFTQTALPQGAYDHPGV